MLDHEIGQRLQFGDLPARREVLEVAETDETGRHTRDHGGGLHRLAVDRGIRADDAQRPAGRDAQAMHRFAAQELADARSQHRAPVAHAGVGRLAAALELQFPSFAIGVDDLAEQDCAPIAQLPGPVAELVAAVDAGQRRAAGQGQVAGKDLERGLRPHPVVRQPEAPRHGVAAADPVGRRQRLGCQAGVVRRAQRGEPVVPAQPGVHRHRSVDQGIHARIVARPEQARRHWGLWAASAQFLSPAPRRSAGPARPGCPPGRKPATRVAAVPSPAAPG